MLYQIHTGRVDTYTDGQEPVIYMVTTVEKIRQLELPFAFTDRHAKTNYADFFDDVAKLTELDWPTLKSSVFSRTEEDPDRPARKQAEFLVHRFVPLNAILGVGVYSQKWKDDCDDLFEAASLKIRVKVHPGWYF
jgi:ssDNA thymidine ADP-ribosyltransferase, DarT